ncbi:MAG: apolipoprotein N-acyltransferase [Amylibacter sp.]|nr:apolipoprotein N-acyltransferase [Amylibacter sp.]
MANSRRKWLGRFLTIIAGLLLALGHAPVSIPVGVVLGLPVLAALLVRAPSAWAGFRLGWLAGSAYFAGSMFWIVEPFFVEPEVYGWMAPFALIFLSAGLALFWAVAFGFAARAQGVTRLVSLVVALTLAEFARAHIFTGFPWGLLAYVWSETPVFQLLAWVGPHGLGMITVALGVLPMVFPWHVARGGMMAVGIVGIWLAGQNFAPTRDAPLRDVTVRLVQPNAPQHLKWHPDHMAVFFQRGLALSKGDGSAVDAVIWPETALPFRWGTNERGFELLRDAVGDAQFIGGVQRSVDGVMYNSMVHFDATGAEVAIYDKSHLVPFGEYIPFANIAAQFGIFGFADVNQMGFAAGTGPRIVKADGLPAYLAMICYEAIFPGLAQVKGARPEWLLHLTNDAWYGEFSGPYQHLVQARARAIEQGLPVARAANTGVSGMIDPYGRVIASVPLNTDGFLDVALPEPLPATFYSKMGELPWWYGALFLIAIVIMQGHRVATKEEQLSTIDGLND